MAMARTSRVYTISLPPEIGELLSDAAEFKTVGTHSPTTVLGNIGSLP